MEIIRASVLGFCFGVRRAIELAQKALQENCNCKVYSLGPLIHNEAVLDSFEKKGLVIINEEEINIIEENSVIVVRTHGVSPEVTKKLEEKKCKIVDATCPRVKASQKMVERFASENDYVILTGDKNHGEVKSIAGYAGKNFFLIQNVDEAQKLNIENSDKTNIILLSQTTFSQKEFSSIESLLKAKYKNVDVMNTICPATQERQMALQDLCSKVEGILVIGGKSSANTRRLYQTALDNCKNVAYVQSAKEIPENFYKLERVGLTAGASTPDSIINEIENSLKNSFIA